MNIFGYTHLSEFVKGENADINFWKNDIRKHFEKGIAILIALSPNLKCLVCKDASQNYNSKGSLRWHYKFGHFNDTIEYILNKIVPMSPEKLQERIQNAIC